MTVMRRARPLLGTLVEIGADAEPSGAMRAVTAAFEAVATVHRLMSAHASDSDVDRLNRFAHLGPVKIDPQTWRVLEVAREVSAASGGAFDICVAPVLARWGYLPGRLDSAGTATVGWRAIELLPGYRVRFAARLAIDLGGIAKGYAADRAAGALAAHGIERFTVNAGGDLRVGSAPETIHVRHPARPACLLPLAEIAHAAVATSGAYFAVKRWRGMPVSPIVAAGSCQPALLNGSVTVFAPECVVADALTKVVAALGEESAGVLARFGAEAFLLSESGALRRLNKAASVA